MPRPPRRTNPDPDMQLDNPGLDERGPVDSTEPANGHVPPIRLDQDEDAVNLEEVLSKEALRDGKVHIRRRAPGERGFKICDDLNTADFSLAYLRRVWGGGDYSLNFRNRRGQMVDNVSFSIDYRLKGEMDGPQTPPASAPTAAQRDDTGFFLKLMEAQASKSDGMLALVMGMMSESQKSQATMMAGMMTAMAQLNGGRASEPASRLIEATIGLINKPQASAANTMGTLTEVVTAMAACKKLFDNKGGDDKDDEGMLGILKSLAPALVPLIAGRGQPQQVHVHAPPPQATQQPPPQTEAKPVMTEKTDPPPSSSMLTRFIPFMVGKAANGSDPADFAMTVLDILDPQQADELVTLLQQDNWWALAFQGDGRVEPHKAWFEGLRTALLAEFTEEASPQETVVTDPPAQDLSQPVTVNP